MQIAEDYDKMDAKHRTGDRALNGVQTSGKDDHVLILTAYRNCNKSFKNSWGLITKKS